jgi:hypothetical protein
MEATAWQPRDKEDARILDQLPAHVVVALDHLTRAERDGVLAAIGAFARREQEGSAIPGAESLYLLWAAPEVRVIVRRPSPTDPVEVEDVVRPATLRAFAQAHAP